MRLGPIYVRSLALRAAASSPLLRKWSLSVDCTHSGLPAMGAERIAAVIRARRPLGMHPFGATDGCSDTPTRDKIVRLIHD